MQHRAPTAGLQMQLTANIGGNDHVGIAGKDVTYLVVAQLMAQLGLKYWLTENLISPAKIL